MASRQHPPAALAIRGLRKSYPGVTALDDVDLVVEGGTVHGIVGENGAGKSTLMKSIAGAETPDAGTIVIGGAATLGDINAASAAGVAMIYQELTIVPEMSALENVLLGGLPRRWGVIDRGAARRRYREAAELIGADIPPGARAGSLSTSAQQTLEIMRALSRDRRLIIMDEPTASLGPEDIARLHRVIRSLRARGLSVLYVSHDLEAVRDICDTVTVMREGRVVQTRPSADWTTAELIGAMLGDVPLAQAGSEERTVGHVPLLEVHGLRGPGVDVETLTVRSGEIIGIAGLVGSGRTRLLRALAGADRVDAGRLTMDGAEVHWPASPRAARRYGILLAPEDRKGQGLVLDRAASWNVALGRFPAVARIVTRRRVGAWSAPFAAAVGFAPGRLGTPARVLSGGNQQKLVLARMLGHRGRCLLLDEPTRGIDVGAKAQIFDTIRRLVSAGAAVVWASSDLTEVAQHSDRILVVASGRVVAELPRGSGVRDILDHAFAATGRTAA